MSPWMKALVIVISLVMSVGCGGFKETFEYQTAASARRGKTASCKTPLRVAVKPFSDARKASNEGQDSFVLSRLGGLVLATPARWEQAADQASLSTNSSYVHDDRRMYAIALWAELTDSGCFAEVAFEPVDEKQYDLVFTGEIQRFAIMRSQGFVPLPLYVGSLVALAGKKDQALLEIDLFAYRPGSPEPVLRYGLQGYCDDECSEDNWIDSVTRSLASGHADFVERLSSYLSSRGQSYWASYAARRRQERRYELDPDLGRLEKAARSEPEPVRAALERPLADKHAALDAIIERESKIERRWAKTSRARVRAELNASNELVDAVHSARVRAAILAVALSAATASAGAAVSGDTQAITPSSENVARFSQNMASYKEKLAALGVVASSNAQLDARSATEVERLTKARKQLSARTKKLLAAYRNDSPSADALIAKARAASEPPTPPEEPLAARTPSKSKSRKKSRDHDLVDLGY